MPHARACRSSVLGTVYATGIYLYDFPSKHCLSVSQRDVQRGRKKSISSFCQLLIRRTGEPSDEAFAFLARDLPFSFPFLVPVLSNFRFFTQSASQDPSVLQHSVYTCAVICL